MEWYFYIFLKLWGIKLFPIEIIFSMNCYSVMGPFFKLEHVSPEHILSTDNLLFVPTYVDVKRFKYTLLLHLGPSAWNPEPQLEQTSGSLHCPLLVNTFVPFISWKRPPSAVFWQAPVLVIWPSHIAAISTHFSHKLHINFIKVDVGINFKMSKVKFFHSVLKYLRDILCRRPTLWSIHYSICNSDKSPS